MKCRLFPALLASSLFQSKPSFSLLFTYLSLLSLCSISILYLVDSAKEDMRSQRSNVVNVGSTPVGGVVDEDFVVEITHVNEAATSW